MQHRRLLALLLALFVAAGGPAAPAATKPASGASTAASAAQPMALSPKHDRLLRDLIARANLEGALEAQVNGSAMPAAGALRDAFVNRFAPLGLNITVNIGSGNQPTVLANALSTIVAGGAPQFDMLLADGDTELPTFLKRGLLQPIDNWQELLAAVDPDVASGAVKADERSAEPYTGYGFIFDDRLRMLLYNTDLTTKEQLPKTYLDLADPRFKGQFTVAPWGTTYAIGAVIYGKERWLEIAAGMGQNAAGVATFAAGAQQLLARQIVFQTDNLGDYFTQKALGPSVPVDYAWLDYTGLFRQYYVVPQRARHPAAATLFALFMATDEGRAALAPAYVGINVRHGKLPIDEQIRQSLADAHTKLISWDSTPESRAMLEWFDTPDGEAYLEQMTRALNRRG